MQILDLTGHWSLRAKHNSTTIPARVPGDNVSALLAARRVPDPHWADNELQLQWVGRQDWIYERNFQAPAALLAEPSVFLNCDGLDTLAAIFINDRRVVSSANMFARLRVEVKQYLRPGANQLRIEFTSPERAAIAESKHLPYPIPYSTYHVQSPHRNLIRKVQCHAGWDWGICLMVSGINGAIYLGATSLGRIEYVATTQRHQRGRVTVEVATEVNSPAGGKSTLEVTLGTERITQPVTLQPGLNVVRTRLTIRKPKLWWPNGYGAQPLYDLTVRVAGDEARKRIGLRNLEVLNIEDKRGLSLTFRVNGVEIYCKGANWIPADALPQRQTRERLDDLLTSVQQAHMNMLRVWGGGQYESEDFYDLCDEKGLLIWQDFMFACALYPATPKFLELVRQEAWHQVKRLRDHACLALWCGNNENVGSLGWFEEARKNRDRYLVDYDRLNEGVLGAAVDQADPTHTFWPSSPCGGRGDYSDCWHDDSRGDMHYWEVWFNASKTFDDYYKVKPRFCSEFGFQSFPSLEMIRRYAPRDQLNASAPIMEWHQRHPDGNAKITNMFGRYFRIPEGFANFVYLSQVQQAVAIKTAIEYWRSLRPLCMGTLFWQINDNWPVCSWSSIEHGGKWKLLQYAANRFYAPVLVSTLQQKDGSLEIWVTNDQRTAVRGTVVAEVRNFAGNLTRRIRLPARVSAGSAKLIKKLKVADLAPQPEQVFLQLNFRRTDTSGTPVQQTTNTHFFTEYKRCDLAKPKIRMEVRAGYRVTLRTDKPAFFVALNATEIRGEFSDNCVTLLPGQSWTAKFTPKQPVTLAAFKKSLTINHLRGTYR